MWSGPVNQIPDGWALCDGTNNTPDLRARFIVGAGNGYNVGDTGGSPNVTLTLSQIPAHNHDNGAYKWLLKMDGQATADKTDNTANEPNLYSCGDIKPAGGGQAHENRPPYYALCYIMKL